MAPGKPDAFFGRRAAGGAVPQFRGVFKTRLTGRGGKMKNCSSGRTGSFEILNTGGTEVYKKRFSIADLPCKKVFSSKGIDFFQGTIILFL